MYSDYQTTILILGFEKMNLSLTTFYSPFDILNFISAISN